MFTGEIVPASGIYRVTHEGHRLPHEVTLLKDQLFPRCSQCDLEVRFELLRSAPEWDDRRGRIVLHELPVYDSDDSPSVA